ncbi:DNA cytosine methyltransferase [Spirosoma oryzae]|uniref:DNA cytosine methyltransferase n=1 Tax=Spirosoma oryzae TaxID=1469603 RepID=UPI0014765842|nr:DNA cytosine methyltransferase [Spirosoma oryzae]
MTRQDKAPLSIVRTMLVNNQHTNVPTSTGEPTPTLTTGNHHYLVITRTGKLAIEILSDDSPATVKIKRFMAAHGIVDIKMRMLNVPELKRIQEFPDGYILKSGDTRKKKFIGNSVVPPLVRRMIEAIARLGAVAVRFWEWRTDTGDW